MSNDIDNSQRSLVPSSSTGLATIGAFTAATIVFIFHAKGIDFPAGYEALMGGAITVGFTYLHSSGRQLK